MEGTSRRLLTWDEIVQGTDAVSLFTQRIDLPYMPDFGQFLLCQNVCARQGKSSTIWEVIISSSLCLGLIVHLPSGQILIVCAAFLSVSGCKPWYKKSLCDECQRRS